MMEKKAVDQQELIKSPEALLILVQKSVQHLIEQRTDTTEQEAQLRAVAKAIEQLEKQQIPVPDSLRQTKMNLVAEIGQHAQFNCQLMMLGEGIAEVLEMIESATGKLRSEVKSQKKDLTSRQRRSRVGNSSITPIAVLRSHIIQVLKELGGSARVSDVISLMQEMLQDRLTPRDLESYNNGNIIWQHNTYWERQHLVNEGILRNDSKRGYWELNKDHASYFEDAQTFKSI
jgi:hypothetical protein